MKLTDKDYIGLFGTAVKVRLYRASSKLNLDLSKAVPDSFPFNEIRFSKHDIRNGIWKLVNIQFDPDWDMSENSQQLVLFTDHNWKATAKATVSVKADYDFVSKKTIGDATGSIDVSVQQGGSTFRINTELSRNSTLVHIVGDTGLGTRERNGISYNVKGVGHLHFYFEHYFTDVPD